MAIREVTINIAPFASPEQTPPMEIATLTMFARNDGIVVHREIKGARQRGLLAGPVASNLRSH